MRSIALMAATIFLSGAARADCLTYKGYPLTQIPQASPDREAAWTRALAPIVKDRSVVMLGEPSHGDGASIRVRAELVKVLHERFGFDVLVFEGDFYGLTFGWPEVKDHRQVREFSHSELYSFWSSAPAAEPLWAYVKRVKMEGDRFDIAGVDIRLGGARSRDRVPVELVRIAEAAEVSVSPDAMLGLRDLLRDDLNPTATAEQRAALLSLLATLAQLLKGPDADATLINSLRSWALFAWNGENRDVGMAANLEWLVNHRFPGRKFIVWAHSNHVLRNAEIWDGLASEVPRHMGNLFADKREETVAVIGTVTFGGQISHQFPAALSWRPFDLGKAFEGPMRSEDSLEADLSRRCAAPTVVQLDRNRPPERFKASAIDHQFEAEAAYSKAFDGLVFVGPAKTLSAP